MLRHRAPGCVALQLAHPACRADCTVKGRSIAPGRHFYHHWCIGDPRLRPGLRPWANVTSALGHTSIDVLKIDIEVNSAGGCGATHPCLSPKQRLNVPRQQEANALKVALPPACCCCPAVVPHAQGHEYPLLASLQAQPDAAADQMPLPSEILIEIHNKMNGGAWKHTHLEGAWQNGVPMPHTPVGLSLVFMHLAQLGFGIYSQEVNKDWYMCCSEFSLLRVPAAAAAAA